MSRYLIHSAVLATLFGAAVVGSTAPAAMAASAVGNPSLGGFVDPLPTGAASGQQQVTVTRSLAEMQLAQTYESSPQDPVTIYPTENTPSSNINPSARGPIGSQGTSGDSLGTTGGMSGGMRMEEGTQSGQPMSSRMMNQSQSAPAESQSYMERQSSAERQSMSPQQQRQSTWWKPWTWGSGMRSQQQMGQEQQNLPSSGAAMRNPRARNETVVEQPWRAPDVPGTERGQTSTGRESRVIGGSPAQLNPTTGADYWGGSRRQPQQEQEQ